MTSRRDFLGILAVAPIAVPAALSSPQPKYASGGVLSALHDAGAWGVVGEDCHGGFVLSPSQSKAFLEALDQPITKLEPIRILMRTPAPWDNPVLIGIDMGAGDDLTSYWPPAPNRLKGAYINDDGDAV